MKERWFRAFVHFPPSQGIYDTLKRCAKISKSAGGIGLAIHCIRASGSYIAGVNISLICVYLHVHDI